MNKEDVNSNNDGEKENDINKEPEESTDDLKCDDDNNSNEETKGSVSFFSFDPFSHFKKMSNDWDDAIKKSLAYDSVKIFNKNRVNFETNVREALNFKHSFTPIITPTPPIISMAESMDTLLRPFRELKFVRSNILKALNSIDFNEIEDGLQRKLDLMKKHVDDLFQEDIYVDIDLFDEISLTDLSQDSYKENLLSLIEGNLEKSIQELIEAPELIKHSKLITQTYNSYLKEDYIVAAMPIHAVIDFFIASWYNSEDGIINPSEKPEHINRDLQNKTVNKKFKNSIREIENIDHVFAANVIRGYIKIFIPKITKFAGGLHRNSILHGYYNFESMTKIEFLKLIQLLKAAMVLRGIPRQILFEEN